MSAETRSAGSRRGHLRRRIRERIRDELILRMVRDGGGPPGTNGIDQPETMRKAAQWFADNLPDYVVDAIEASAKE